MPLSVRAGVWGRCSGSNYRFGLKPRQLTNSSTQNLANFSTHSLANLPTLQLINEQTCRLNFLQQRAVFLSVLARILV